MHVKLAVVWGGKFSERFTVSAAGSREPIRNHWVDHVFAFHTRIDTIRHDEWSATDYFAHERPVRQNIGV